MIKPPCFAHLSEDDYFGDKIASVPTLSQSVAHTLVTKSPKHAWLRHPRLGGQSGAPTRSMDKGSLCHKLLLQAGKGFEVCRFDDWRTKAAQEQRKEVRAQGLTPVLQHEYDDANAAADAIRAQLKALGIVLDGESEVAAVWEETTDDGESVLCRGLLDHWSRAQATIFDLKMMSKSAHPVACATHMVGYGYDIQAAAYTNAVAKIHPELVGRLNFVFLFCEFDAPHVVTPATLAGSMRQLGDMRWRRAINSWAECLSADHWPGYTDQMVQLEAPAWALSREMELGLGEELSL
jgi:hypothetical protein